MRVVRLGRSFVALGSPLERSKNHTGAEQLPIKLWVVRQPRDYSEVAVVREVVTLRAPRFFQTVIESVISFALGLK